MPQAGTSPSLWTPPASASAPILPDADTPIDKLETETPSCPTTPEEKTPGLSDHEDGNRDGLESPTAEQKICEKESDFYQQYSAYWQFWNDGYTGESSRSRTSWGDTERFPCNFGRGEDEANGNDPEEGDEVFVEHSHRMASWAGQPDIKGRNETVRMMLLCAVHFGITFTWGVEMTCEPSSLAPSLSRCWRQKFFEWCADCSLRASQTVRHTC